MAGSNGSNDPPVHTFVSTSPEQAELRERVTNQSRRISDIEGEMRSGFNQVNASIQVLSNELRSGTKTQWPVIWAAIGVSFSVLAFVGSQALGPIKDSNVALQLSLTRLAETMNSGFEKVNDRYIPRDELDQRATRSAEDRERTNMEIGNIRTQMLPRNEWAERNQSRDHEIASLQKQIDLQRADFQAFAQSLGNGRDFITDIKSEVGRLRDQISDMRARYVQRLIQGPPAP